MYENSNKDVLRELTQDNYRSHKTRNRLGIMAIALTTILITAVLTVGISVTTTALNYGESAPGPGSIGSIAGTMETKEQIQKLPNVVNADYIAKCSRQSLRNNEFTGMSVYLMAAEQSYYDHNYVKLEEGHFPETPQEVILSDNMVKKLGLKEPIVGNKVTLHTMIQEGKETVEKKFTFTVCGYFKNPLINIANVYDEIYTSMDFIPQYNPEIQNADQNIYVKVNDLNPLLMKTDVIQKLEGICDAVGAEGYTTKYTSTMSDMFAGIIPALLFVLFIILSGYFLIYNVFYLSVTADIRWFGMLKTLGTTARQLKKILMAQIKRLAVWGICIGVVLGYVVGDYLAPGLMAQTIYEPFYEAPNMLLIFCAGAVFSWITVYISAHRSLKIASRISPVEAAKYTPKKRKNLFTILSFALSGIMFMAASNVTLGYSVDKMIQRYNMDDMRLIHEGSMWVSNESYQPIQQKTVEEIKNLSFVKNVDVIYVGRSMEYEFYGSDGQVYYDESKVEVKLQGKLEEVARDLKESGILSEDDFNEERNSVRLKMKGLPSTRLERQIPYVDVLEGELDAEKFATGDYVLWEKREGVEKNAVHAGDSLDLTVYDGEKDSWQSKTVTVLAVVCDTDMYGTGDIGYSDLIVPVNSFQELLPSYDKMIGSVQIQTEGELTKEEAEQITAIYEKEHFTQAMVEDCFSDRGDFESQKHTMSLIGMFLASLFGIIGLSNMVNTMTSDVFSRKIELATMQSIGMTKRQLWKMLFLDSLRFSLISVAIMLPVGSTLSYFLSNSPLFTGFSLPTFFISTVLLMAAVVALCVLLTEILVRVLNKKSVVERLREIE